jgi:hypothetical protein
MVATAIGSTLPLAFGVALNPIAIVVAIVMLGTATARWTGIAFTIGWVLGLTILLSLIAWVIQDRVSNADQSPTTLLSLGRVGLGVILILAAFPTWRGRALPGEQSDPPRWMGLLTQTGGVRAMGIGLFLSMVSLKNLALLAAAASLLGQAGLGARGLVVAVAVFVVISSIGILVPLLVHLVGGAGGAAMLNTWQGWLSLHAGRITAIVMALLGANLLFSGIGGLV